MTGKLPLLQAAFVVARRDFTAILFGRAFIFFLLGPLFPAVVMALAGGVGARVQSEVAAVEIGVAMEAADVDAMLAARSDLADQLGGAVPPMVEAARLEAGEGFDPAGALGAGERQLAAVITGTPAAPELTAPAGSLDRFDGVVALVAARAIERAEDGAAANYPTVALHEVATSGAAETSGRLRTAQSAQVLLFLMIMLLAGMVLSNLAEEKGNKIIEILSAAIPMDAVFLGKLFAMLGISVVGLCVWGGAAGLVLTAAGHSLADFANPALGWPLFIALFAAYFAMGYLLLGAIFLAVGAQAATVREVQTLSMPVTMLQILVFFFASLTVTSQGEWIEYIGMAFPLTSPFVMVTRAATDGAILPHLVALGWQGFCVLVFVRTGARLFRRRVMQSGPRRGGGLFSKGSARTT